MTRSRSHTRRSEPTRYPRVGAEPWFDKYANDTRATLRRVLRGWNVQLWMTRDSFESVLRHYTAFGIERPDFAKSLISNLRTKSGREVRMTYVVFDGAANPLASKHYVCIQHPVVVSFEPLEVHDVTQIGVFRRTTSRLGSIWSALLGRRGGERDVAVSGSMRPQKSRAGRDERWPIRSSGTSEGVTWTLAASPAVPNPDGRNAPDVIWWASDAVSVDGFLAVVGYAVRDQLDWPGHFGVQNLEEAEDVVDGVLAQIVGPDAVSDVAAAEARAYREHPWATLDQFLERATDLTVSDTRLRDLQIKTTEPELVSRVLTDRVIGALERAKFLVNDHAASLRIWVGAPNLRIHLASVIDDDRQDDRPVVLQKVVDLGVALARSYQSASQTGVSRRTED